MMMLIDIGNTRVKWLLAPADAGGEPSPIAWQAPNIGWPDLASLQAAQQVGWVGVASDDSQRQLRALWLQAIADPSAAAALAMDQRAAAQPSADHEPADHVCTDPQDTELAGLHRLRSAERGCGLVNGYRNPTQLGADRWAAAMAAWRLRQHASDVRATAQASGSAMPVFGSVLQRPSALQSPRASLIVSVGTATTVDHLSPDGRFLGGSITPGFGLMRESLAQGTARLPRAAGVWQAFADNTDDAITTGIVHAQLGALLAGYRWSCDRFGEPPCVWLTGGAAPALLQGLQDAAGNKLGSDFAQLAGNILHAPSLVLEGVRAWLLDRAFSASPAPYGRVTHRIGREGTT